MLYRFIEELLPLGHARGFFFNSAKIFFIQQKYFLLSKNIFYSAKIFLIPKKKGCFIGCYTPKKALVLHPKKQSRVMQAMLVTTRHAGAV